MKKILLFALITMLITSCVSQPETPEAGPAPDWISQMPGDGANFYIGISGSNSGDQATDQEAAYSKALNSLASAIFTEISSEMELQEQDSSQEGSSFTYQNNISANVNQNLQDVETVDSYYSPETGYWYYLRLSKDRWNELVEQRSQDFKEMAEDLFFDIFRDSLAELKAINRAMMAFEDAYSGQPIKMELLGQRGSVDTILVLRAITLLGEMELNWAPLPRQFQQGQDVEISGSISLSGNNGSSPSYEMPGALTLLLTDQNNRLVAEIPTEPDGDFSFIVRESQIIGPMTYSLTVKSPFTQNGLKEDTEFTLASATQQSEITARTIGFELESNWEAYGLYESVFTQLENLTLLTLSSQGGANPTRLRADLAFRQAPPNEFDMVFSYVRIFISLVGPSGEQLLWESEEVKEAGLSVEQANQRAVDSLLEEMNNSQELMNILAENL